MNKAPKKVIFFANGNTAAFDENGNQMPEMQRSWLECYMLACMVLMDPRDTEFTLPDGRTAKPFRLDNGRWNWEVV